MRYKYCPKCGSKSLVGIEEEDVSGKIFYCSECFECNWKGEIWGVDDYV